MLHLRGGVHLFGNDDRLTIQLKWNGGVCAGGRANRLVVAVQRLERRASLDHSLQVVRRGTATSANDVDTVLGDEPLVILGELFRLEGIVRVSANVLRQPGVGQNGQILCRVVS